MADTNGLTGHTMLGKYLTVCDMEREFITIPKKESNMMASGKMDLGMDKVYSNTEMARFMKVNGNVE